MDRQPCVAGQFYSPGTNSLKAEVNRFLGETKNPRKALAAIAPHAGYIYSGRIAGTVFSQVIVPKTCLIISPNHTGLGKSASVWKHGNWIIPTGSIPVDSNFASTLLKNCPLLAADQDAHISEHSIEVILPFLLARQPQLSIIPITVSHLNLESCKEIGKAIALTIKDYGQDVLIVASTDMNHYEEQKTTTAKDELAINNVIALDAEGLLATCAKNRISMCGVVPTTITIFACNQLGAKKARLIKHETSGDVSGDYSSVVGYAGFLIE